MRRLVALLGALVLTGALALIGAGVVGAAPKLQCSVSPVSAPAGSVFTVNVTGANGIEREVYWYVGSLVIEYDADAPHSGKFSSSQQIPVSGDGLVVVYNYEWSSYTTAYCRFTAT
jgi:hypothetical protein